MKTERILFAFFIIGVLLKFSGLPFGGPIMVVFLPTLAMLYFPGAFYFFSDQEIKQQKMVLSIVSGIVLSVTTIGVLFKLMYWPGAQSQLFIGVVTSPIICVIVFIQQSKAKEELKKYYQQLVVRTVVWTVLGGLLYVIPMEKLVEFQYRKDPELARLKVLVYTNPGNKEYKQQHDDYIMNQRINQEK